MTHAERKAARLGFERARVEVTVMVARLWMASGRSGEPLTPEALIEAVALLKVPECYQDEVQS